MRSRLTGRIKTRVGQVVGQVEFNEILSVFYREGQKMNWHDDGEAGLGEHVASLSLGGHATMSWRRKHGPTVLSITLAHGVSSERSRDSE